MKKMLLMMILLALALPSWAAVTRVQSASNASTSNVTSIVVTLGTPTTVNNTVVFLVADGLSQGAPICSSVMDNANSVYTKQITGNNGSTAAAEIWTALQVNAGARTITCTASAASGYTAD